MKCRTGMGVGMAFAMALTLAGCTTAKKLAYEGFGRDGWQKPEAVIDALGLGEGDYVADLGSGTGYFTFDLADAVGATGRVYAIDVDEQLVKFIDREAGKKGYTNVVGVLADFDDPKIPAEGVDLIFTCNTFHHIGDRPEYFDRVKRHLRPGGRVAIVEYDGRDAGWFQRHVIGTHATSRDQIVADMEAAGYETVEEPELLDRQSFLIFAPRTEAAENP